MLTATSQGRKSHRFKPLAVDGCEYSDDRANVVMSRPTGIHTRPAPYSPAGSRVTDHALLAYLEESGRSDARSISLLILVKTTANLCSE